MGSKTTKLLLLDSLLQEIKCFGWFLCWLSRLHHPLPLHLLPYWHARPLHRQHSLPHHRAGRCGSPTVLTGSRSIFAMQSVPGNSCQVKTKEAVRAVRQNVEWCSHQCALSTSNSSSPTSVKHSVQVLRQLIARA